MSTNEAREAAFAWAATIPQAVPCAIRGAGELATAPSPATFASETNKDRTGQHGSEVA